MLHKIKDKARRLWFDWRCQDILSLPPFASNQDALTIVSMVSHKDILMYLLAVKSLCHRLRRGQVIVVNDGSLTVDDALLLSDHLPGSRLLKAEELKSSYCPKGGTWERLILISELAEGSYVIQIDSDTLTLNDIKEVEISIDTNTSFTLATGMGRAISSMGEVCAQMRRIQDNHIQVVAEQNFCKLTNYDRLRYVRGCSGFAGFGKGSLSRAKLESLSDEMRCILKEKWTQWGSEQVTSNICIANSPQATVLPYPKYANFTPELLWRESIFLHFIGTYRFQKGVYIKKAREVASQIGDAHDR